MKNRPALLAIVLTIIASVILAGMDSLGKYLIREFSTCRGAGDYSPQFRQL